MRIYSIILIGLFLHGCTIRDKQPEIPAPALNPYEPYYNQIKEGELIVRDGDLIVRNGQEFSSQFIKNFNRVDKSYSHAGIVFYTNGYPYVYHIVPGDENPDQKIRTDSLKNFCNPRKNFGFGIYRYQMDEDEIKSMRQSFEEWYSKGVSFDSAFNLKTDNRMYCSEMIKKGLEKASNNRIRIATTKPDNREARFFASQLHLPLSYTTNLEVVSIDNLFTNQNCKAIRRFEFTSQK